MTVGHPCGETTLQVRGKNFLFLRHEGDELSFSVKLPRSAVAALALPFVKPTEYGIGRHGWVTCRLKTVAAGIQDQCLAWLEPCLDSPASCAPAENHDALVLHPVLIRAKPVVGVNDVRR